MTRRLSGFFSTTSILILFGLITACGPVMKSVTDYTPPLTDSGMRCIEKANEERDYCSALNQTHLQQCIERAAIDADRDYAHAKDLYTKGLEDHIRNLDIYEDLYADYEETKRLILRDGELEYVQCSGDVNLEKIKQFPQCETLLARSSKRAKDLDEPRSPIKPRAPNRANIFSRLKNICADKMTDCDFPYNQSYRACGGAITHRQVCIENCD